MRHRLEPTAGGALLRPGDKAIAEDPR